MRQRQTQTEREGEGSEREREREGWDGIGQDGMDGRGMRYLRAGIDRLAIPHVISACCMEQFFLGTFESLYIRCAFREAATTLDHSMHQEFRKRIH